MIFSLATPARGRRPRAGADPVLHAGRRALRAAGRTAANALLNARYRTLALVDSLQAVVEPDAHAGPAARGARRPAARSRVVGRLMQQQAALADQLQSSRNLLLEAPRTAERQRLAGMLMQLLDMRDHLVACALDLDALARACPTSGHCCAALAQEIAALADDLDAVAEALLLFRQPAPFTRSRPPLPPSRRPTPLQAGAGPQPPSPHLLARVRWPAAWATCTRRSARLVGARPARARARPRRGAHRLAALREPHDVDVAAVPGAVALGCAAAAPRDPRRAGHRLRAGPGHGAALGLARLLDPADHRGGAARQPRADAGAAQRARGRHRCSVACSPARCSRPTRPRPCCCWRWSSGQSIAHAFAIRRYLVTAVAATVLSLVQAHLLSAGVSPVFDVAERMVDTAIGVLIAWVFSYVLPSWERTQIAALVARTVTAQARHAKLALGLGQLQAVDNEAELAWRLARREAYDSLSALVQAVQRSLVGTARRASPAAGPGTPARPWLPVAGAAHGDQDDAAAAPRPPRHRQVARAAAAGRGSDRGRARRGAAHGTGRRSTTMPRR